MKGSLTMNHTSFLIIGAGPYSIAAAAYAKYLGVDVIIVGKPLDFWKTNVPRGMFLRSGSDWQLDAREVATFEAYLRQRGVTTDQIKPVPLETFLDYASWFMGHRPRSRRNLDSSPNAILLTLECSPSAPITQSNSRTHHSL